MTWCVLVTRLSFFVCDAAFYGTCSYIYYTFAQYYSCFTPNVNGFTQKGQCFTPTGIRFAQGLHKCAEQVLRTASESSFLTRSATDNLSN